MKLKKAKWKLLVLGFFVSGIAFFAYAQGKTDPLEIKLEEVSVELFGKADAWSMGDSGKPKVTGLFSPKASSSEIPTIAIRNNAAYDHGIWQIKELKKLIEQESQKRAGLDYGSRKFQTLVDVSAKYVEIQRALFLNFVSNVHELGISPKAFDIDALNLKVDAGVGGQLMIMTELQKKYSIRHTPDDPELKQVELFIPAYDRLQIEIAGLSKVKTKVEYQKLIHLMYLRDSLVNRWSINRILKSPMNFETLAFPPALYASFAEDKISKPSDFNFSKDLGVEDRYQVRIVDPIDRLSSVLENHTLGGLGDYRKLVKIFYNSFSEFKGLKIDAESVVASLYHVEETALAHASKQIIFESNFPQDDLSPEQIAKRIATNAFRVRKAAFLTAVTKRIKTDLATVRGYLEPDENGMVDEKAVDQAQDYIKLSTVEMQRAEKQIDPYFSSIEAQWRTQMELSIQNFYASDLPGGELEATRKRYAEFFNRILDGSTDGVFAAKQVNAYQTAKKKLDTVSNSSAGSLSQAVVPVSAQCYSASMGQPVCSYSVNSSQYLSRLDAKADLGMSWVTPWTPAQVASLFSKKIETIEKKDRETWEKIKETVQNKGLMKQVASFFEELNTLHQAAVEKKQSQYSAKIQDLSNALAKQLGKNPDLDLKKSDIYAKILDLQEKVQGVGVLPEESVLTEEIYQKAAKKIFSAYLMNISIPPPVEKAPPTPTPSSNPYDQFKMKPYVAVRDATYVKPPVLPIKTSPFIASNEKRAKRIIELGKLFSLLGFGDELFAFYRTHPMLTVNGRAVSFVKLQRFYPKPDAVTSKKIGYVVLGTPRSGKVSALSECSRSALDQKLLSELIMANVYTRVPFLRIQNGDDEKAATGLERLASTYSMKSGYNRDAAHRVFLSLLTTATLNDRGKVEEALSAKPNLPVQDEKFKRIFRSQAHNRSLFMTALDQHKAGYVEDWDQELRKETRTTSERWSDRMNQIAGVIFVASMVFLLWEFLPVLIPAMGSAIPTASAFFSSFSVLGMSGSVIAGFLSGSNLFVQLFFMATVAAQGQVAFFTLPAQLQYQKEIANSTVGLTALSKRILAPAERASRENIQQLQEEIRSAKLVTGVMAVVQVAFLPLQIKQLTRGFGKAGKVALSRFGEASPGLVESMRPFSLSELIGKHGYAKGSQLYFQRYTSAIIANKPTPAINGGATLMQAQELLANSLSTHLSSSTELASLFEARLEFLKGRIVSLRDQSRKYFGVTQGSKAKALDEKLKMFFGKEISTIGFKLSHPQVKLAIRSKVAQAMEEGLFTEIEYGSEKYLLKAFLLRIKAEKLMHEAVFISRAMNQLRSMEAAAGGVTGTREVLLDFTRLDQLDTLDSLLKWATNHPEYQNTPFGDLLAQARRASKDYKIIVDDINRLTPRERATYQAMQGDADVVVNEDLTLQLGTGRPVDPTQDEYYVIPGLSMGLEPKN